MAIIDEFDNVVVDRGLDITMLSTSSPGMESLWLVHGFIYSVIKTQVSQKSDLRNIHPEFLRKTLGLKEYGCKVYPELEDVEPSNDPETTSEQAPSDDVDKAKASSKISDMLPSKFQKVLTLFVVIN